MDGDDLGSRADTEWWTDRGRGGRAYFPEPQWSRRAWQKSPHGPFEQPGTFLPGVFLGALIAAIVLLVARSLGGQLPERRPLARVPPKSPVPLPLPGRIPPRFVPWQTVFEGTHVPGISGRFVYRDVSFHYPPSWKAVNPAGYYGLPGMNVLTVIIGVDRVNRVVIASNYSPWDLTGRSLQEEAERVAQYMARIRRGRVIRPIRFEPTLQGLIAHFAVRGLDPDGNEIETEMYLFGSQGYEWFFDCQHEVGGIAKIRDGCELMASTLERH